MDPHHQGNFFIPPTSTYPFPQASTVSFSNSLEANFDQASITSPINQHSVPSGSTQEPSSSSTKNNMSLQQRRSLHTTAVGVTKRKRIRVFTDTEKAQHRRFEKSRRESFKVSLSKLAAVIPATAHTDPRRLSKHTVTRAAAHYIRTWFIHADSIMPIISAYERSLMPTSPDTSPRHSPVLDPSVTRDIIADFRSALSALRLIRDGQARVGATRAEIEEAYEREKEENDLEEITPEERKVEEQFNSLIQGLALAEPYAPHSDDHMVSVSGETEAAAAVEVASATFRQPQMSYPTEYLATRTLPPLGYNTLPPPTPNAPHSATTGSSTSHISPYPPQSLTSSTPSNTPSLPFQDSFQRIDQPIPGQPMTGPVPAHFPRPPPQAIHAHQRTPTSPTGAPNVHFAGFPAGGNAMQQHVSSGNTDTRTPVTQGWNSTTQWGVYDDHGTWNI